MATKTATKKEVKLSSKVQRVIDRLRTNLSKNSDIWVSAKNKETKSFRSVQLENLDSEYNSQEWFSLWLKIAELTDKEMDQLVDGVSNTFMENHKNFTLGLEHPYESKDGGSMSLGILKRQGKPEPTEDSQEEDDNLPF